MRKQLTPFQQALLDSVVQEYAHIPQEEALPDEFSERFKEWAEEFLAKHRPGRLRAARVLRRVLIAALIAVLLAGAAMAIPAVREAVIGYFFHQDAQQIGITFDPEEAATAPDEIKTFYTITYMPETFMRIAEEYERDCAYIWCMNELEQWIVFTQHPMPDKPSKDTWWSTDGEEVSRRSVLMGDYLVEVIQGEDNYKLVWTNNAYLFTLELPYSVGEEEMQKIFASWGPKE